MSVVGYLNFVRLHESEILSGADFYSFSFTLVSSLNVMLLLKKLKFYASVILWPEIFILEIAALNF